MLFWALDDTCNKSPLINRLTPRLDQVLSKCRRSRHRILTQPRRHLEWLWRSLKYQCLFLTAIANQHRAQSPARMCKLRPGPNHEMTYE